VVDPREGSTESGVTLLDFYPFGWAVGRADSQWYLCARSVIFAFSARYACPSWQTNWSAGGTSYDLE